VIGRSDPLNPLFTGIFNFGDLVFLFALALQGSGINGSKDPNGPEGGTTSGQKRSTEAGEQTVQISKSVRTVDVERCKHDACRYFLRGSSSRLDAPSLLAGWREVLKNYRQGQAL
jgi:hypothetical protein